MQEVIASIELLTKGIATELGKCNWFSLPGMQNVKGGQEMGREVSRRETRSQKCSSNQNTGSILKVIERQCRTQPFPQVWTGSSLCRKITGVACRESYKGHCFLLVGSCIMETLPSSKCFPIKKRIIENSIRSLKLSCL